MVKDRADAVEWELSHENSIEIRSLFLLDRQKRSDGGSSCKWLCGVGRFWRSEKRRTCPLRDDRREGCESGSFEMGRELGHTLLRDLVSEALKLYVKYLRKSWRWSRGGGSEVGMNGGGRAGGRAVEVDQKSE
ncbi:hypothetical protein YC2023_045593 [Brassica napus]